MILHSVRAVLPFGFAATFSFTNDKKLGVAWEPDIPLSIGSLKARRRILEAYLEARDDFLRDIATMTGITIAMVNGPCAVADASLSIVTPSARQ